MTGNALLATTDERKTIRLPRATVLRSRFHSTRSDCDICGTGALKRTRDNFGAYPAVFATDIAERAVPPRRLRAAESWRYFFLFPLSLSFPLSLCLSVCLFLSRGISDREITCSFYTARALGYRRQINRFRSRGTAGAGAITARVSRS